MIIARAADHRDIFRLAQIDRLSSPTPWKEELFARELEIVHSHLFVAVFREAVAGFICVWHLAEEMEIHSLAVDPAYRKRGVGSALLAHVLQNFSYRKAFLEVREGNCAAKKLYAKFHFIHQFTRKGYYPDGENGLVLSRMRRDFDG